MAEIGRQAEAPGLHVLWSQMIEEPAVPPYFAWLLLLRAAIQCCSDEVLAADARSGTVHLADLVPELRDRLELPSGHGPSDARSRFQLFDAVTRFLLAAAQRRPLVLLFDNLHLADRSSIEMLELLPAHLGKSGRGGRRRLRAKRRQPPVRGRSRRRAGAAHPAGFFSAATPRFKVPQTLGALIATRLESLPAETIGLLDIVAVLGRDFGAGALAHHSLCNDVMTALEPAEAAGIVALLGTRRFRFHHALFREVPTRKLITWTCPVRTCRPLPTWNSHWEVRLHHPTRELADAGRTKSAYYGAETGPGGAAGGMMAESALTSRYEASLSYYLGSADSIGVEWPKGTDVSRFYRAVRIGFNVQSALTVRQRTHIRAKVFNRVLPRTTLQSRRQCGARLNPEQSEKVLRIVRAGGGGLRRPEPR